MNTIIKVNAKELSSSVGKAALVQGKAFIFSISAKKIDESGAHFSTVSSASEKAQAIITIMVDAEIQEDIILFFGTEFKQIVTTLSQCGDTIEIETCDGPEVKVRCGNGEISLSTLEDGARITHLSPRENEVFHFTVITENLKYALRTGAFCFTPEASSEILKDSIHLKFSNEKIGVSSLNGNCSMAAKSECEIERVNKSIKEGFGETVGGSLFYRIMERLNAAELDFFIFKGKQILVRNENDFFTFLPKAGNFPDVNKKVTSRTGKEVNFELDVIELLRGTETVLLNQESRKIVFDVKKDVTIQSLDGKNIAYIKQTGFKGEMKFALDASLLKEVVSHCISDKITITKETKMQSGILITEKDKPSVSLIMPVQV